MQVKFNIDLSFLEGFIEFIKFINAYTQRERKNQEEFMKGVLKIAS